MMETVFWNSFVWVGKLIMAGMYVCYGWNVIII
jgi:hypothetical protein